MTGQETESWEMSFTNSKGTRGVRMPAAARTLMKCVNGLMAGRIAKSGRAFGTMPTLVLITVGLEDGPDERLIAAAYAGAAQNPAWYHNLAALPPRPGRCRRALR